MCHRVTAYAHPDDVAKIRTTMHDEVRRAYPDGAEMAADTALVVSELAANAVQAGADTIEVTVDMHTSSLTVQVRDDAAGAPQVVPTSSVGVSGRGLAIVAALAAGWGVRPTVDGLGKTVWATLRADTDARPGFACHLSEPV